MAGLVCFPYSRRKIRHHFDIIQTFACFLFRLLSMIFRLNFAPPLGIAIACVVLASCSAPADNLSYRARLADHLSETGAMMYGAYWCPHCAEQKAMFDSAASQLPLTECDPNGENAQPQLCIDKGVRGYPTWEINGQLYPGVQSLSRLAELSAFEDSDAARP